MYLQGVHVKVISKLVYIRDGTSPQEWQKELLTTDYGKSQWHAGDIYR